MLNQSNEQECVERDFATPVDEPISVVIPAHDEEAVIGRCLRSLLDGARPGELDIVVVCNGCADATAEVARGFGAPVRVFETPIRSKIAALNIGDTQAVAFPRFYVDADIVLPLASLRAVARVLAADEVLAAAPGLDVDLRDRPWSVRAFYQVWTQLPYVAKDLLGSGVYALSREGRARFDQFPDVVADDGFIERLFEREERALVRECSFRLTPPDSLWGLIRVKTRTHKGNHQLSRIFGSRPPQRAARYRGELRRIFSTPRRWPSAAVYLAVMGSARILAGWKIWRGDLDSWERDDASRRVSPGSPA